MAAISFGPDDPAPVEVVNPKATSPVFICADHAGNSVPKSMNGLGISYGEINRHIGWDIGAAGVSRKLAEKLKATAVLATYSRLLIDPNRPLSDPNCVPVKSDGTAIPANASLTQYDIDARADAFYWPYHNAADEHIGRLGRMGKIPVVIAMHTFTPALNKDGVEKRPWHIGILYSRDTRLPHLLMEALSKIEGVIVGDNEPYSGITHGYSLKVHGIAHGLPHVELEIRQDLVEDDDGQEKWAELLARILPPILDRPEMKEILHI